MITEFAPAKLNLYLHITGRRPDGYHDLDSLVAFAGVGDEVKLEQSSSLQLVIEGPQAEALRGETPSDNLILKAAKSLAELTGKTPNVKFTLVKNLPVASGIGGGSSDAAAALRALAKYWDLEADDPRLLQAAAKHGQDVPVCVKTENNYMTATGMAPAPALPHADIVMVNPNKGLSTPDVYKAYKNGSHTFSPLAQLAEAPKDLNALVGELKTRSNDLYEPAAYFMPEIKSIITALEKTENAMLARMSGSGATCFGIYSDRNAARQGAAAILAANPGWWVVPTYLPLRPRED